MGECNTVLSAYTKYRIVLLSPNDMLEHVYYRTEKNVRKEENAVIQHSLLFLWLPPKIC